MRWRALFLSGLFAASVGLTFVSSASADPPPWAGRWRHNKHYRGDADRECRDRRDHRWSDSWRYRNDAWRRRDSDWRYGGYWPNGRDWRYDRSDYRYWRW